MVAGTSWHLFFILDMVNRRLYYAYVATEPSAECTSVPFRVYLVRWERHCRSRSRSNLKFDERQPIRGESNYMASLSSAVPTPDYACLYILLFLFIYLFDLSFNLEESVTQSNTFASAKQANSLNVEYFDDSH